MLDKKPLSFKPNDDEEEYLNKEGKLDSWSNTVHNWIKEDKQKSKTERFNKLQSSLLLIFIGVLLFSVSYVIPPFSGNNFIIIVFIFICSAVSITFGSFTLFMEYRDGRR